MAAGWPLCNDVQTGLDDQAGTVLPWQAPVSIIEIRQATTHHQHQGWGRDWSQFGRGGALQRYGDMLRDGTGRSARLGQSSAMIQWRIRHRKERSCMCEFIHTHTGFVCEHE